MKKKHESSLAAPRLPFPPPRAAPAESVVLPVLRLQRPRVHSCHPRVWCSLCAPQCTVWGAGPFPRAAPSLPRPRALLWRPPWPSPGSHTALYITTHTAPACGLVRARRSTAGVSAGHLSMRAASPRPPWRPHTHRTDAQGTPTAPPRSPAPLYVACTAQQRHNTSDKYTPYMMDTPPCTAHISTAVGCARPIRTI